MTISGKKADLIAVSLEFGVVMQDNAIYPQAACTSRLCDIYAGGVEHEMSDFIGVATVLCNVLSTLE